MQNWFYTQLAMYAAYHRDHRNQLTHHVGVPMIVFSLILAAALVPLAGPPLQPLADGAASQPEFLTVSLTVSLATLLVALLMLLYIVAVPLVGLIALLQYGLLLAVAESLVTFGADRVLPLAGVLFVFGWIIQFWGHVYEGRKPALFDNLLQVFMAPAFLIAELLFAAGLLTDLKAEITPRMAQFLPADP